MKVIFHKKFEKQYRKLNESQKTKFKKRIAIFLNDPFDPILNNHSLRGKYKGYRSISITGNLRAIYKATKQDVAIFITINTHSKLYS